MARRFTRIEPGHDRRRLRGPTHRESKCSLVCWLQTLGINRDDSRIKNCSIRVIDADLMMVGNVLRQDEPVGSRRQDGSRNLNGLVKPDFVALFLLFSLAAR